MQISPLTNEQRESINKKINSLSYPNGFIGTVECKLYQENLFQIYESEITGFNKDYAELLRNNNHRIIRAFIETQRLS